MKKLVMAFIPFMACSVPSDLKDRDASASVDEATQNIDTFENEYCHEFQYHTTGMSFDLSTHNPLPTTCRFLKCSGYPSLVLWCKLD